MICLRVPGIPPSSNQAYFNNRYGGRTLSDKGRAYKNETLSYLAMTYPKQLKLLVPDVPYLLYACFYLEAIENKKKDKTRYKRMDTSNRLKLFEDCLKDAGGIDDSQFLWVVMGKRLATNGEETVATLWNLEKERINIDDVTSLGPV